MQRLTYFLILYQWKVIKINFTIQNDAMVINNIFFNPPSVQIVFSLLISHYPIIFC